MRFWPFKKQSVITFKATAKGHYPVGLGCREVYFNLYEDQYGNRSYEEFVGREFDYIPRKADFSAKMQVEAWQHSKGDLPRCTFNPFKNDKLEKLKK